MTMKKQQRMHIAIYSGVAALVLLAGAYLYTTYTISSLMGRDGLQIVKRAPRPKGDKPSSIHSVGIHESRKYTRIDVDYPELTVVGEDLNPIIAKLVTDGIAEHEKNSEETFKARYATRDPKGNDPEFPAEADKYPYHISYLVMQNDGKSIGIVLHIDEFSGGAHGASSVVTYNYNVLKGKMTTVSDLFPEDKNFLEKLSTAAVASLIEDRKQGTKQKTLAPDEVKWIKEGASPKAENFTNFIIIGNRLTLYFSDYQVGPHSIGMPTIDILLPLK